MIKAFARDLKHIREEKNISLRDISIKTRLNISVLESLENADYSFQPQTYIRAFLKQYISALDLDVEEVLFDYDLARSGKYKQKFFFKEEEKSDETGFSEKDAEKSGKPTLKDKLKEIVESPKKIIREKKTADEIEKSPDSSNLDSDNSITDQTKISSKHENRVSINPNDSKQSIKPVSEIQNTKSGSSFFSLPVVKNVFGIIFILLVLLGLYALINILFIKGKSDSPEIVRQNFDEVVQEQEKKILGKKTPEEINDSIKKAQELSKLTADSIVLTIKSTSRGSVYISSDSVNYSNPEKITFDEGETGTFNAARFFHISSGNTEAFTAFINNVKIKFNKKSISKVKITKDGITD